MTPVPEIFQRAASFNWETLLPLLFFVLYGLAQFIGSRKKPGDEETGEEPEVDPMERARQIREEIRRKIEARKEQHEADRSGPVHESDYRPSYDPNVPETQQPRPVIVREPMREQPKPAPPQRPAQRSVVLKEVDSTSSNLPVPDFEKRLKEQRQRIAESRKRQQEVMAQTRRMKEQTRPKHRKTLLKPVESASVTSAVASPARLRREILAGLRDPSTLRRAVLYREILDPPVGLR
jgi:hypothetical protein